MVGSCTNSTSYIDSCWSTWYGDIELSGIVFILGFIMFIFICISFNLKGWVDILEIKRRKSTTKNKLEKPNTSMFISTTVIFMFIIGTIIINGMDKSLIFALYHIVPITTVGTIIHIYQKKKYNIEVKPNSSN